MPASFASAIANAWNEALADGKAFEIVSEAPDKPIDAARNGRVEWRTVYDEEGVKLIVSHVHNRHAAWFSAPVAVTA